MGFSIRNLWAVGIKSIFLLKTPVGLYNAAKIRCHLTSEWFTKISNFRSCHRSMKEIIFVHTDHLRRIPRGNPMKKIRGWRFDRSLSSLRIKGERAGFEEGAIEY